ncbi:uncharacterized protein LOC110597312 [Ictidomys tridecemlineatus]
MLLSPASDHSCDRCQRPHARPARSRAGRWPSRTRPSRRRCHPGAGRGLQRLASPCLCLAAAAPCPHRALPSARRPRHRTRPVPALTCAGPAMGTRAPRGHLPLPALQKPVSRARSSSPVPNGPTGRKSRPAARPWPGRPPSPQPHPAPEIGARGWPRRRRRARTTFLTRHRAARPSVCPSVRPSVRAQKGPGVGPAAAPWTALRRLPSLGTGNLVTCAGVLASAGHIHKNLSSPRSGCFNIPLPKSAVADRPKGDLSLVTIPQVVEGLRTGFTGGLESVRQRCQISPGVKWRGGQRLRRTGLLDWIHPVNCLVL